MFDDPIAKDREDSNTYRLGITHRLNGRWALSTGFAPDQAPTPKKTAGFELPESGGKIVSLAARYKACRQLEITGTVFHSKADRLRLSAARIDNRLNGEFGGGGALLLSPGAVYRFD